MIGKQIHDKFMALREEIKTLMDDKNIPTTHSRYHGYDSSWSLAATLFFMPEAKCLIVDAREGDFKMYLKNGKPVMRKIKPTILRGKHYDSITLDDIKKGG